MAIPDRLSALPDDILHHILSFLDAKSLAQTSILSRRWTSLWKYVHVLTFYLSFFGSDESFEQYVDRVLSTRSDSSSVSKVAAYFLVESPERKNLLDRIVKYAASHGVKELFICPGYGALQEDVSGSVYACYQSLKVLELRQADFLEASDEFWSSLQMLESLTLTTCGLSFDDDSFGNFPRLRSLKLVKCIYYGLETGHLKITGPKLLNLEIVWSEFTSLEIVAPKLQSFALTIGYVCGRKYESKSNLTSLTRANIKLFGYKHVFYDSTYYDADKQLVLEQCVNLFKILHNVQVLDLEVECLELLIQICNSEQSSPFKRMKSLNLKYPEKSLGEVPNQITGYFLGGSTNGEEESFTV